MWCAEWLPALRAAMSRSSLSRTSGERANKASISSRVFPVAIDSSQHHVMWHAIREGVELTLRAQEVDVGCGEEAAQQGPDENLGADSVDTSTTTKDHDESGEPFTCSSETASDVTVLQWCDFRTVDPAGAEPAEGEDNLVENDYGDSTPV